MASSADKGIRAFHAMTGAEPELIVIAGLGHGKEISVMQELWPIAKFVAFEPLDELFHKAKSWFPGYLYNGALGSRNGKAELLTSFRPDTRATMFEMLASLEGGGRRQVDVMTLDKVYSLHAGDWHEVLLWLDTQGSENEILSGSLTARPDKTRWMNVEMNCCSCRSSRDGAEMDGVFVSLEELEKIQLQRSQSSRDRKMRKRKVPA
jgi:FkbM family methyltransferase